VAFFLFATYPYNIAMNTPASSEEHLPGIKKKIEAEAKQALALTVYFATWFCALTFFAVTNSEGHPMPLSLFGIALIKAGLCAKFMLIAQAIFPIKVSKTNGIIKSLFLESLFYIFVVLSLNYIEAGIEGLMHGKNFIDAMAGFGQKNPLHVLAMTIVYWLIVWPYLVLVGLRLALGEDTTIKILFGRKDSVG
jgi:hypothetical protein